MKGAVVAVCSGPGGIPKQPSQGADVVAAGLVGDGHRFEFHGGLARAVCLLSVAEVRDLTREGIPSGGPGAFGENLLVQGMDLRDCRPGEWYRVGRDVILELTDVRSPCRTLKAIDPRFPDIMLGRSGYLARVHAHGHVAPGDSIERIKAPTNAEGDQGIGGDASLEHSTPRSNAST